MKFVAIADLHLSMYAQDSIIPETSLPERLHSLNIVLRNVANYSLENDIKNIVIAGDIFHNKSIIHSLAQSIFLDYVRDFLSLHFIIVSGNHDMSSKSSQGVSALKSLDNEPNVNMIHNPTVIENISFIPWNPETMVGDIKNSKEEYLVAHFGLNEAQLSSGISIVSDIGLKDLIKFKHCILGHYHLPQSVGNVTYVGSPIQLDWGEKGEEKRFLIVDTDSDEIKSIPTIGYKKYIEYKITNENKEDIIIKARKSKKNGHYVQLVKHEDIDVDDINKEFKVVDKTERDITDRGITISMSQDERIDKYLKIKKIKEEDFERYKKVAIDIMNSCEGD